jgi:mRNA-degrading endonuclease RelE of RelBE toxin-antitoxin system
LSEPLEVLLTGPAERDLRRLDPPVRKRVVAAIERLSVNPEGPATTAIVGREDRRRASATGACSIGSTSLRKS